VHLDSLLTSFSHLRRPTCPPPPKLSLMAASFATSTASLTHAENARLCSTVGGTTKLPTGPTTSCLQEHWSKTGGARSGTGGTHVQCIGWKHVHGTTEVGTRLAVESGLGHILEITKNAKSSMLGVADFAPASFLRLGRDQEAYDFMKW
jgi:hypothetical protein